VANGEIRRVTSGASCSNDEFVLAEANEGMVNNGPPRGLIDLLLSLLVERGESCTSAARARYVARMKRTREKTKN
jgi:hypothetical protein